MSGDYIGALVLVALAVLACYPTVRAWDARLEERRRERDWAKYVALVVRQEEDDTWAAIERATGMEFTPIPPIGEAQAQHIFRHQLDDPEAVERFMGGAA